MTQPPGSPPRIDVADGIATITLRRPAHRNRLHNEDLALLLESFGRIDADRSIQVVVLTAEVLAGRPVFSAGYNKGEFEAAEPEVNFEMVVEALERLRPVTVCALNGSVYGGATDFTLACDIAIAMEGIEMRMPAAALGLHYYPSGLVRYVTRLGVNVAKWAFLTGQALDAATLLRVGYVQELVPAAAFDQRVRELAASIARLAPLALETLKLSLTEIARGEADLDRMAERQRATMASADFAEGRQASGERRPPVWKGC